MSFKQSLLTIATLTAVGLSGTGFAASYASTNHQTPMPMGNWYVQGFGGVGFATNNNIKGDSIGFPEQSPRISYETGYDLGAAIGYRAGPWRLEAQYTYMRASVDKVSAFGGVVPEPTFAGGSVSGRSVVHGVLANALFDINGITDFFSPFVGVGVGYARINERASTNPLDINLHDNVFAYQATGGVSYNVDNSFTVDLLYRYFATGKPSFHDKRFQNHILNLGITYHIPE
jgi:opacity protein-like surface antigen